MLGMAWSEGQLPRYKCGLSHCDYRSAEMLYKMLFKIRFLLCICENKINIFRKRQSNRIFAIFVLCKLKLLSFIIRIN